MAELDTKQRDAIEQALEAVDVQTRPGALSFPILVAPRAARETVGPVVGDRVRVAVNAPPVDGKANAAIVALLAASFGVRRADVEIVSGERGKRKLVRIAGASEADLLRVLGVGN